MMPEYTVDHAIMHIIERLNRETERFPEITNMRFVYMPNLRAWVTAGVIKSPKIKPEKEQG